MDSESRATIDSFTLFIELSRLTNEELLEKIKTLEPRTDEFDAVIDLMQRRMGWGSHASAS
jgi:hypothetical protein